MAVLDQAPGLPEALRGEMTPKFLATRSVQGVPNVVPVITLRPAEDRPDVLFFGNFLLRKSIRNLQEDARTGILVITPELRGWVLQADFLEFQGAGPYFDRQMNSSLLRYNAYTGIRDAGLIQVRAVEAAFDIPRLQVARDYLLAKLMGWGSRQRAGQTITVPAPVQAEFGRLQAVKVLAWIREDGYPVVVPELSLQPAGEGHLACWRGMPSLPAPPGGAQVAANILTFDAISYQVKGRWSARGRTGSIQAQEVYAGGPPIPGGRVA